MPFPVRLCMLGIVDYQGAWLWQQRTAACVREGTTGEALALLQHPPVYTLGRRTRPEHLLAARDELRARGAGVVEVDRGGGVTFHGPGQLVGYPILNLNGRGLGPVEYVRCLEATLIDALESFGVRAERVAGRPGVWSRGAKVAAIGVRVQGGVTTHGFALNVAPDLSWFEAIVPCGLSDATITSMEAILGDAPPMTEVEDAIARAFSALFEAELTPDPETPRGQISGPGAAYALEARPELSGKPPGLEVRPSRRLGPRLRSSSTARSQPIISHGR